MVSCLFPYRLLLSFMLLYSIVINSSVCSASNKHEAFREWWTYLTIPTASADAYNVSETCFQHSQQYRTAFRSKKPWAVKMYEASGRIVEDLIHIGESGDVHHETGLFDECLAIESDGIPFQGQYCTVFFGLKPVAQSETTGKTQSMEARNVIEHSEEQLPEEYISNYQKPTVGFCLPSSCSASDLRSAVAQHVGYRLVNRRNFSIVAMAEENYCYTQSKIDTSRMTFDTLTVAVLTVLCMLGIIVIAATAHDVWNSKVSDCCPNSFAIQVLECFSAKRNYATLFSTKEEAKDSIRCLHGIRVLSTCWIVMIHSCGAFYILRLIYNKNATIHNSLRWDYQFITNGLFVVDTFFVLSGLLVSYTHMRQLDQNRGSFDLKRFYFRRYLRLTPVYAAVTAFLATLWPYVGNGPDWNLVQRLSKGVRRNLLVQLLYIHNYVNFNRFTSPDNGFGESWYLACDMQMFWISPLFIYPLWRWKRSGFIWAVLGLFLLLAYSLAVFVMKDVPPVIVWLRPSYDQKIDDYARWCYEETFVRMPPYLIGIILGWLLYKTKDTKIHINKYLVAAGWIGSLLIGLIVTYGMLPYLDEKVVPVIDPLFRVTYGALHRPAWALAVSWAIFACTHGYGGILQRFLSSGFFIPLSRLSYTVYLIHFGYLLAYAAHLRKAAYISGLALITFYFGVLVIVFAMASVISVAVEMPFLNLEKLFFPKKLQALEKKKRK